MFKSISVSMVVLLEDQNAHCFYFSIANDERHGLIVRRHSTKDIKRYGCVRHFGFHALGEVLQEYPQNISM